MQGYTGRAGYETTYIMYIQCDKLLTGDSSQSGVWESLCFVQEVAETWASGGEGLAHTVCQAFTDIYGKARH